MSARGEVWVQAPMIEALLKSLVDEVGNLRRAVERNTRGCDCGSETENTTDHAND